MELDVNTRLGCEYVNFYDLSQNTLFQEFELSLRLQMEKKIECELKLEQTSLLLSKPAVYLVKQLVSNFTKAFQSDDLPKTKQVRPPNGSVSYPCPESRNPRFSASLVLPFFSLPLVS